VRTLDNLRTGGAKIAFDTNFRPRLWDNMDEARRTVTEFLRRTDLVLPTYADETQPSSAIQLLSTPLSGCIGGN